MNASIKIGVGGRYGQGTRANRGLQLWSPRHPHRGASAREGISEILATARVLHWRSVVAASSAKERAAESLEAPRHSSSALSEHTVALSRGFHAQFDMDDASLWFEVVNKPSCPKFHGDGVRVRLVTTDQGPATEYAHAADPQTIGAAPLFAVLFLMGCQHLSHADTVQRRLPAVPPGGKRLCVILDV